MSINNMTHFLIKIRQGSCFIIEEIKGFIVINDKSFFVILGFYNRFQQIDLHKSDILCILCQNTQDKVVFL